MIEEHNRVAFALMVWREREARFEKLFPDTLTSNRPFLKDKLAYLDGIQAKFRRSSNEEERLTLNILKQQRSELLMVVHPNPLFRLLYFIILPFRQKETEAAALAQSAGNMLALKETLQKVGFGQAINQLEVQVKIGLSSFSIPQSFYVNEKERMSYDLSFSRDSAGLYHFDGYNAALHNANKQIQETGHSFKQAQGLLPSARQAYNLLAGRALNVKGEQWIQLDLNDKDAAGNYKVKDFPERYGYDLSKAIDGLPLKYVSPDTKESLLRDIGNGERMPVVFQEGNRDIKLFIEANPQYKTVILFDEQQKKINAASLLDRLRGKNASEPQVIVFKPAEKQGRKNGQSI